MSAVAACCSSASLYAVWRTASSLLGAARVRLTPARAPRLWFCAGRPGGLIGDRAPSPNSAGAFEGEARHELRKALQGERAERLELEDTVQHRHRLAIGEDLARFGFTTQARGEIRDVADRCVVPPPFEADGTERCIPLRDADAKA